MIKDEIFKYAKIALADKNLDTVLNDDFRGSILNYFSNLGYNDIDIDKIQFFMTALVDALKKTGLKKLSMKELEDFLYFYSENEDKSNEYVPGIYRGEVNFEDSFVQEPMYENNDIKILHLGTLHYDNNQESIEKYRVVRFAKERCTCNNF